MGRSRDIADMLGKTELSNPSNAKLITEFSGVDSAYVSTIAAPALVFYSTLDSLPVSGLNVGQQAYVSASNRLYISDGSGWYSKALITLSPTITMDPTGVITLANDGTTTSTVTVVAADSDTPGSGLTYSVDSDGNGIGKYVISQDSSVFTIRPLSSDSGATEGTFALTFSATDGDNIATDSSSFSLTFATEVSGSASTISLVKAHGNTKTNNDISYYSLSTTTSTGFTEAGDPTAATFSPYRSGGYSTFFPGYFTDRIYVDPTTGSDFAFGTGDFTVEAWVYLSEVSSGDMRIAKNWSSQSSTTTGQWLFEFQGSGADLRVGDYTAGKYTTASTSCVAGIWYHVAVSREGSTVRLFVNGVSLSTTDTGGGVGSVDFNRTNGEVYIGYGLVGYIKDLRVVKGTAVYTANFTAPTEPLTAISGTELLTCHLPYLADGSTNDDAVTVVGNVSTKPFGPFDYNPWSATDNVGSVHLDGTGDYLTTASSSNFAFGTGDFTWEMWLYHNEYEPAYLLEFGTGGDLGIHHATAQGHLVYYTSTTGTGSSLYTTGFGSMSVGKWYHIAAVRDNGTTYLYTNGVLQTSASDTHNYGSSAIPCRIGAYGNGGTYPWTGYIADLRILKGTAVYTSAFTPPTEPHARNSSAQLLMQNLTSISTVPDAGVYDAAAAGRVTLTGNWTSNSATRKFTTSSAYGGTGSLQLNDLTPEYTGGDFTIQFWLYPAAWSDNGHIFGHWIGGQYHQYLIYSHTGTDWKFYASSNGSSWNLAHTASVNIARWTNSWKHVAMTYDQSAGTVKFWLDGTLASTHTGITGMTSNSYTTSIFSMMRDQNDGYSAGSHYLQDVKISRSVEYTANFTPPTAEFEL